jgi:hypothetical protein
MDAVLLSGFAFLSCISLLVPTVENGDFYINSYILQHAIAVNHPSELCTQEHLERYLGIMFSEWSKSQLT